MRISNLVTVVVPIYNAEKHLFKCINSIVNQTYRSVRIILVNDGSTDSSLEICKQFESDKRILIITKDNEGLSSARQIGFEKAKGEYICTVDSDDYIEADFITKMHNKISSENADICVCGVRHYSDKYNKSILFEKRIPEVCQLKQEDIETNFYELSIIYHMSDSWNKMYSAKFINKAGTKFTLDKKYNGTDLLFNHILLLHSPKITVMNESLYNYQIVENSRVRRKDKQLQKGFMIIIHRILEELDRLDYSDLINVQISRLYVVLMRAAAQDLFNNSINQADKEEIFKEFIHKHMDYLDSNYRIKLKIKYMSTISQKIFCHFLYKEEFRKIIKYFEVREKVFKIK